LVEKTGTPVDTAGAKRKLAAILAADVAGYSRLMGSDEEATHRRLGEYRKIIDERVARHGGRIFGSAGDSAVADFASPVEAVRCAVEIQETLGDRNADLPEERRMHFRIGINLGDVIVDGGNLFGDGVNVAARLESLARPGGICVSASVHEQVRGKLDLSFKDLGRREVKNIKEPVRAYQIRLGGAAQPGATPKHRRRWRAGAAAAAVVIAVAGIGFFTGGQGPSVTDAAVRPPSILVTPFQVIGDREESRFIADGLNEDLIVILADRTGFRVAAANQANLDSAGAREAGRRAGADFVLEGSVRASSDRVRITALLISSGTGYHLWGARYDRDLSQVLTLDGDVADTIVATLADKLMESDMDEMTGEPAPAGAVGYFVSGLAQLGRFAEQAFVLPLELYRRAVNTSNPA
jgi:adenylate cyclase